MVLRTLSQFSFLRKSVFYSYQVVIQIKPVIFVIFYINLCFLYCLYFSYIKELSFDSFKTVNLSEELKRRFVREKLSKSPPFSEV